MNYPEEGVRANVASALGQLGNKDVGEKLLILLAEDAQFDTMCKALAELMRRAKLARDTAKQQRIKKTEKAFDCREHRDE